MMAGLLTNGYLLSVGRIERLNRAGLDRLQISIDNVVPDDVSVKSLKVLDKKLEWLAQHAHFDVNINTVVGNGIGNPEDALTIARRAMELGFGTSVGVIHDASGQIVPLEADRRRVHAAISNLNRSFYSHAHDHTFPAESDCGSVESLALPRRRALSVCLRGWSGALVLAAARHARNSADALWTRRSRA